MSPSPGQEMNARSLAPHPQIPHQRIPRPNGALAGGAAPWAALSEERRRGITVHEIRRAFGDDRRGREPASPVPGSAERAELDAPPSAGRRVTPAELSEGTRSGPAAVLCVLFDRDGEANVVLTRRSAHLRSHSGEVSFPGGRLQPGEVPLEAALREAHEEIGLDPGAVEVIGELTPLRTVRSPVLVHCFVGHLRAVGEDLAFSFNPGEVEKVFWVPLARLAREGVYHEELWPALEAVSFTSASSAEPSYRAVPFFHLDEDIVWGATGRLLTELLTLVLVVRVSPGHEGRRGPADMYPGRT